VYTVSDRIQPAQKEVIMVLVRYVFQIKWGRVGEVVAVFKESQKIFDQQFGRSRIFTDLSGPLMTVVQEIEVESLAEWEQRRGELYSHPQYQELQARASALIESGRAEFYTIES
jgi:NIPSNAP protein